MSGVAGSSIEIVLATANPEKVRLLGKVFSTVAGKAVHMRGVDPVDAEDRAVAGYEAAATAKAVAVAAMHPGAVVLGHDCGFEFACLNGAPGPLTARTLNMQGTAGFVRQLVPGTRVRVVHSLTVRAAEIGWSVTRYDDRRVADQIGALTASGTLPLGRFVTGDRRALDECAAEVMRWLDARAPSASYEKAALWER